MDSPDVDLLDTLATIRATADLSGLSVFLAHARVEARILAVQQLASSAAAADALVNVASTDADRWVRYAAMAALREHRASPSANAARVEARGSGDKLMRLAERAGMGALSPELESEFRNALAKSPESEPLALGAEVARKVWPSLLLEWRDVDHAAVRADQADIEAALLAKKDLLRFSSEALYVAEAHFYTSAQPDPALLGKYGKPQVHLILVNARDPSSFHEEDPIASIPTPSLEQFGSRYGLGGNGNSFERHVGMAQLCWPVLRRHASFVAGARGKRSILVGVHHPEVVVPVLGTIAYERPRR